jgi:hypothetical protein
MMNLNNCNDPCFESFIKTIVPVMTSMSNPMCSSGSGTTPSSRRLLGGMSSLDHNENTVKMEAMLGVMCSKNAAGKYCMNEIHAMSSSPGGAGSGGSASTPKADCGEGCSCKTDADCKSSAFKCTGLKCVVQNCSANAKNYCDESMPQWGCNSCTDLKSMPTCDAGKTMLAGCAKDCDAAFKTEMTGMLCDGTMPDRVCNAASVAKVKNMGCCFGTMLTFASVLMPQASGSGAGSGSDISTATSPQVMKIYKSCGIITTPCAGSLEMAEVTTNMKLSGMTKATFDSKAQGAFKDGVAKTAGVKSSAVVITGMQDVTLRRATGLEVTTKITVIGSAASTANVDKMKAGMTQSALTTNIQAAATTAGATNLQSASVASAPVVSSATVDTADAAAGSSSSGPPVGLIIGIVVGVVVVIAVIIIVAVLMTRPQQTVQAPVGSVTAESAVGGKLDEKDGSV